MTTYIKQAQSGRSMIEMLGVLAIIGVLSAGGIAGYSMAMSSYKANNLMDKVQMISTQARILYNGKYPGTASTDANADADSSAAKELKALGYVSDFANPFGKLIYTDKAGEQIGSTGFYKQFTIAAGSVPQDACVKYLTSSWGDSSIFISVGAGEKTATPVAPLSVADALLGCSGKTNTVTWTFK